MKTELYYVAFYTFVMRQLRTAEFDNFDDALIDYEKKKARNCVGLKLFKREVEVIDTELRG